MEKCKKKEKDGRGKKTNLQRSAGGDRFPTTNNSKT
jgi:hypothetical protein